MTFDLDIWHVVSFSLTISSLKVNVIGQSSRSRDENVPFRLWIGSRKLEPGPARPQTRFDTVPCGVKRRQSQLEEIWSSDWQHLYMCSAAAARSLHGGWRRNKQHICSLTATYVVLARPLHRDSNTTTPRQCRRLHASPAVYELNIPLCIANPI